uniref:Uncharacterized protein n=1 Tax=Noccaea caerulescens TaxID=107243 RepID=A0A1J3HYN2_NOCCA
MQNHRCEKREERCIAFQISVREILKRRRSPRLAHSVDGIDGDRSTATNQQEFEKPSEDRWREKERERETEDNCWRTIGKRPNRGFRLAKEKERDRDRETEK